MRGRATRGGVRLRIARAARAPWVVAAAATVAAVVFGCSGRPGRRRLPEGTHRSIAASAARPYGRRLDSHCHPTGAGWSWTAVNHDTGGGRSGYAIWPHGKPTRVTGTDGGTLPFWSPDGTELAFFAEGKLKKSDCREARPGDLRSGVAARRGLGAERHDRVHRHVQDRPGESRCPGGAPATLTSSIRPGAKRVTAGRCFFQAAPHPVPCTDGRGQREGRPSTIETLTLATGKRTAWWPRTRRRSTRPPASCSSGVMERCGRNRSTPIGLPSPAR